MAVSAFSTSLPSKSMKEATWNNTTVLNGDLVSEIRRLKAEDGPNMAILGSGSIIAQLANPQGKTLKDRFDKNVHVK